MKRRIEESTGKVDRKRVMEPPEYTAWGGVSRPEPNMLDILPAEMIQYIFSTMLPEEPIERYARTSKAIEGAIQGALHEYKGIRKVPITEGYNSTKDCILDPNLFDCMKGGPVRGSSSVSDLLTLDQPHRYLVNTGCLEGVAWNCSDLLLEYRLETGDSSIEWKRYIKNTGYFTVEDVLILVGDYLREPFTEQERDEYMDALMYKMNIRDVDMENVEDYLVQFMGVEGYYDLMDRIKGKNLVIVPKYGSKLAVKMVYSQSDDLRYITAVIM